MLPETAGMPFTSDESIVQFSAIPCEGVLDIYEKSGTPLPFSVISSECEMLPLSASQDKVGFALAPRLTTTSVDARNHLLRFFISIFFG